jgi:predicted AAA+ superfamily ATPase
MVDYIPRLQEHDLKKFLCSDIYQVAIIYGARRIGKTTLVKKFLESQKKSYLFKTGDDLEVQNILSKNSLVLLKSFIGNNKLVFIDEAQRIENIAYSLKILVDHNPKIIKAFPISQLELNKIETLSDTSAQLESRLIYGSYPVIITHEDNQERKEYLLDSIDSYLLKDLLEFDGIRNSNKIKQLLRLIAFQIGKEVSQTELAGHLDLSKDTVAKYLDLLEKAFVIYSRQGFSKNLRSELTRNYHYYFFDNGIRNALINNFNSLDMRDDLGLLWENYIITERFKKNELTHKKPSCYFWRTYEQQEIDLIEEIDGELFAFEIKANKKTSKIPSQWKKNYPSSCFELINRDKYLDFIG